MYRTFIAALLAALLLGPLSAPPAYAAPSPLTQTAYRYYSETGHTVTGRTLEYFDANGGVAVFGLPLTEPIDVNGRYIQYFERALIEITPDTVMAAPIGRLLANPNEPAFAPPERDPSDEAAATGFYVDSIFRTAWTEAGGSAVLGDPISYAFMEHGRLVQYYERARLEWREERGVERGLLGVELAERNMLDAEAIAPVPQLVLLATSTMAYPPDAATNVRLSAARFGEFWLAPGQTGSFLGQVGEVSARRGYVPGEAVGRDSVQYMMGGGICYTATVIHRAALLAGLPIVQRQSHTIALQSFQDWPGTDAAIDTGGTDLRWVNDYGEPLLLRMRVDPQRGTVTADLYGAPDGREVSVAGPFISRIGAGATVWQLDTGLAPDATRVVTTGRSGSSVNVRRVVSLNGETRVHTVRSYYMPVTEVVAHGSAVAPPGSTPAEPPPAPTEVPPVEAPPTDAAPPADAPPADAPAAEVAP